jgi:hypothetical protein
LGERLAEGAAQPDLARTYGVSQATISRLTALLILFSGSGWQDNLRPRPWPCDCPKLAYPLPPCASAEAVASPPHGRRRALTTCAAKRMLLPLVSLQAAVDDSAERLKLCRGVERISSTALLNLLEVSLDPVTRRKVAKRHMQEANPYHLPRSTAKRRSRIADAT